MKNIMCTLVLLTGIGMVSCNSDRSSNGHNDSLVTDSAIFDSSSLDSVKVSDSVIRKNTEVDSGAVGSIPPGL